MIDSHVECFVPDGVLRSVGISLRFEDLLAKVYACVWVHSGHAIVLVQGGPYNGHLTKGMGNQGK